MNKTIALAANACVDADTLHLPLRELAPAQTQSGRAYVGTLELGTIHGCSVGVWEITPSVSTDVEADEIFVVMSGRATVSFADGMPDLQLRPGSVARLRAGSRSTWNVTETLRKIYIVELDRANA
jgi:uncharacterized cupin superfamily protein